MNNVFFINDKARKNKKKCLGNVHIIVVSTKYWTKREILIPVVQILLKPFPTTIDGKGIEIHRMI